MSCAAGAAWRKRFCERKERERGYDSLTITSPNIAHFQDTVGDMILYMRKRLKDFQR